MRRVANSIIDLVEIADVYLTEKSETKIDSRFWRSKLELFGDAKKLIKRKERKNFEASII